MPIFEFVCSKCQFQFDVLVSNAEKYNVHCPECGNQEVQQKLSVFSSPKGSAGAVSQAPMPSG